MTDAADINAVLEDLGAAFAEMRKLQHRAGLIARGDRDDAVKRRMIQALAETARMQRRRIDELLVTLHTVSGPALKAAGIDHAED